MKETQLLTNSDNSLYQSKAEKQAQLDFQQVLEGFEFSSFIEEDDELFRGGILWLEVFKKVIGISESVCVFALEVIDVF